MLSRTRSAASFALIIDCSEGMEARRSLKSWDGEVSSQPCMISPMRVLTIASVEDSARQLKVRRRRAMEGYAGGSRPWMWKLRPCRISAFTYLPASV